MSITKLESLQVVELNGIIYAVVPQSNGDQLLKPLNKIDGQPKQEKTVSQDKKVANPNKTTPKKTTASKTKTIPKDTDNKTVKKTKTIKSEKQPRRFYVSKINNDQTKIKELNGEEHILELHIDQIKPRANKAFDYFDIPVGYNLKFENIVEGSIIEVTLEKIVNS